MSDSPSDSQSWQDRPDGQAMPPVGDTLKTLRETRGLTLSEVSSRIKYSSVQLGYLECGDWARLPDGVPLRGLVRNYARFLEADVDAVLRLLDGAVGAARPRLTVSSAGMRRAIPPADMTPRGEPAHRTWAWVLLILVLFCVIGLYAINRGWVPDQWLVLDWLKALRQ